MNTQNNAMALWCYMVHRHACENVTVAFSLTTSKQGVKNQGLTTTTMFSDTNVTVYTDEMYPQNGRFNSMQYDRKRSCCIYAEFSKILDCYLRLSQISAPEDMSVG